MPYIEPFKRDELDPLINMLAFSLTTTNSEAGDLNYVITKILLAQVGPEPAYDEINKIIGVLECAKQEFYRRYAAPYEDDKIKKNGDVY